MVAPAVATKGVQFTVAVNAVGANNNIVDTWSGNVSFSQTGGTAGTAGPPRAGVFTNGAPLGQNAPIAIAGGGVVSVQCVDYSAETVTFSVSGQNKTGTSAAVSVK